ncbi:cobalt-precorrin-5B (C(1))-methyltransferase [Minwuia thermotolerans]|uniref:Cobalt-precorrin-5B C(1)-methyltransferase n=1 Tax=Minwuia thermotolerans TaxID=2056226 RepID=A0A2M9G473_9PROT|nr:cobalt-precorrin-5B (C(1))-methyltransferase [Minwuia thermotolerans]PJK30525.1 cobalt-precorrin-5B (C(1))-methyltransferase [Minwuia thermotolerans]
MAEERTGRLRSGWTTGACATAAAKAAFTALLTGRFPDPVTITLPKGQTPAFALAYQGLSGEAASAGVIKDAGDDPDVTHGALIVATVRRLPAGSGVRFRAGEGVGTITKPGLPLPPGEPAINPVPRDMMRAAIFEAASALGAAGDAEIEISIPGGEKLAERTWNGRLGIEGGLSILGTTGIVKPFSCAAWIASIHRGVDVAVANGFAHVAAATGSTSEAAVRARYGLDESHVLDMGDFIGGTLKYLKSHPVPRLTIAGGFAKLLKFAQGANDLHSGRSQVDFARLAATPGLPEALRAKVAAANTAKQALDLCGEAGFDLAGPVAEAGRARAAEMLAGTGVRVGVMIVDRQGGIAALAEDASA